jgi:hypothetical protein
MSAVFPVTKDILQDCCHSANILYHIRKKIKWIIEDYKISIRKHHSIIRFDV